MFASSNYCLNAQTPPRTEQSSRGFDYAGLYHLRPAVEPDQYTPCRHTEQPPRVAMHNPLNEDTCTERVIRVPPVSFVGNRARFNYNPGIKLVFGAESADITGS